MIDILTDKYLKTIPDKNWNFSQDHTLTKPHPRSCSRPQLWLKCNQQISAAMDENSASLHDTYDYLFKFLVIGSAGAGKSCLLHQFIEGRFKEDSSHTIVRNETLLLRPIRLNYVSKSPTQFALFLVKLFNFNMIWLRNHVIPFFIRWLNRERSVNSMTTVGIWIMTRWKRETS